MVETVPMGFNGTLPEWLVYRELTRLKVDFDFQSGALGGRMSRGGVVLDFWIPSLNLAINVMSEYWHYGDPEARMRDKAGREALIAQGVTVVYIDEADLERNAKYYVEAALRGEDYSRVSEGVW